MTTETLHEEHLIQEDIPEYAVICCDANDSVISWDTQAEQLFGWSHDEALGYKLFNLIIPETGELRGTNKLSTTFHRYRKNLSFTLKLTDTAVNRFGQTFPIELIISPLPGGDFFTIFIWNIDIIRKKSQQDSKNIFKLQVINTILKISLEPKLLRERLANILSYLTSLKELNLIPKAALYLVEQDTKQLILNTQQGFDDTSDQICEKIPFGHCHCGKAALTNKLQFISPDEIAASAEKEAHKHLAGHYCVPIASHGIVTGVICLHIHSDHQRSRWTDEILAAAAQVIAGIIDHQKMDLQLISLVNDLRASIIALREEKNFSESVVQGLEHGLMVTDINGNIQKYNEVARKIFSQIAKDLDGQNLTALVGRENARQILESLPAKDPHEGNEVCLINKNGEDIIIRYSSVKRVDTRGRQAGTIISLSDISNWQHVRKEMEKMNRLSTVAEIASAVAHEVRNPLAGIKIMAQSIEEGSGTEEEKIECSQRIIRQVDRLNELLTDFFSYARPVVPKKQKISLQHILSETKPLIINKIIKQKIKLTEQLEDNLPAVIADPNQVQQVFLNLFLNSIDAIKQEGTIEIIARRLTGQKLTSYRKKNHLLKKDCKYVVVDFIDNGAGMSKTAVEKVFEPFFTTKTNGSGLGMSIVYRTLKENDASILVESTEGKGTTFTMFFKSA